MTENLCNYCQLNEKSLGSLFCNYCKTPLVYDSDSDSDGEWFGDNTVKIVDGVVLDSKHDNSKGKNKNKKQRKNENKKQNDNNEIENDNNERENDKDKSNAEAVLEQEQEIVDNFVEDKVLDEASLEDLVFLMEYKKIPFQFQEPEEKVHEIKPLIANIEKIKGKSKSFDLDPVINNKNLKKSPNRFGIGYADVDEYTNYQIENYHNYGHDDLISQENTSNIRKGIDFIKTEVLFEKPEDVKFKRVKLTDILTKALKNTPVWKVKNRIYSHMSPDNQFQLTYEEFRLYAKILQDYDFKTLKINKSSDPDSLDNFQRFMAIRTRPVSVNDRRINFCKAVNFQKNRELMEKSLRSNGLTLERKIKIKTNDDLKKEWEIIETKRINEALEKEKHKDESIFVAESYIPPPPPLPATKDKSIGKDVVANPEVNKDDLKENNDSQEVDNSQEVDDSQKVEWSDMNEDFTDELKRFNLKYGFTTPANNLIEEGKEEQGVNNDQIQDFELSFGGKQNREDKEEDETEDEQQDNEQQHNDDIDENNDTDEGDDTEEEDDDKKIGFLNAAYTNCSCIFPDEISLESLSRSSEIIDQFANKKPDYKCLLAAYQLIHVYLKLIHNSSNVPSNISKVLKCFHKFRHNYFSYLFMREVLQLDAVFDTDVQFKYIDSNRTPDHIVYDESNKIVYIYEFTVVMSRYRANFLKGTDNISSVYRNEINMYSMIGYKCEFYPIPLVLTESLDENIASFHDFNFEFSDYFKENLRDLMLCFNPSYNYIYNLSFQDLTANPYPKAEVKLTQLKCKNDSWKIVAVQARKFDLYKSLQQIKKYNFEEGFTYTFNYYKNNTMQIRQTTGLGGRYTFTQCKNMAEDEYMFFKTEGYKYKGKEVCHLISKTGDETVPTEIIHHGTLVELKVNDLTLINNKNKYEVYTLNECKNILNKCRHVSINDLNKLNDLDLIKKAIEVCKNKFGKFEVEDFDATPPIVNSERRSFLCLIDTKVISPIKIEEGIKLQLDVSDTVSMSSKVILQRRNEPTYGVFQDRIDAASLMEYKNKNTKLYSFLKNEDIDVNKSMKRIRIELKPNQRQKFDELYSELKQSQSKYIKNNRGNNMGLISCDKSLSNMINEEKNWSKNKGFRVYMGDEGSINNLIEVSKEVTMSIEGNFNYSVAKDSNFFTDLKNRVLGDIRSCVGYLFKTNLYNWCKFISILSYTLFAASNRNFNSKKILLDNLGFSNVVLMVKGGKKITTTRMTKIFKLIYPVSPGAKDFIRSKDLFYSNGCVYEETPWMQLNQAVLQDQLALHSKLLAGFYCLFEKYEPSICHDIIALPTLLAIHNRRKTEANLHNMRYLVVNCLGSNSQVDKLLPTLVQPGYTKFDYSIYKSLFRNYIAYVKSSKVWVESNSNSVESFTSCQMVNPFLGTLVNNVDHLTYIIYCTYMMSKGHYQQSLEQVANLKNVMETHDEYQSTERKELEGDLEGLLDNDFVYSKENSYMVGKYLSSELRQKNAVNFLNTQWYNTMSNSFDELANNRGLRYKDREFFGNKGYFVVYKEMLKEDMDEINKVLNSDLSNTKVYKKLKEMNISFKKKQSTMPLEQVKMHIVDKSQRGGGREIYVMDFETKLYQYPLEKFVKSICKYIDNEIISVPSNRRAAMIHHKCFEFKSDKYLTKYLSFDCRKWAPRCNPEKYIYMILGMSDVLPDSFVTYTINYFLMHEKKQIHTRESIKKKFLSNPQHEKYEKYFIDSSDKKSSFFEMPYSFVMGIFNMLSSLFHAGGLLMIKDQLYREGVENNTIVDLDMFAHSDDSGGRLSIGKDSNLTTELLLDRYEVYQKTINHLMSVKKCSTSDSYFELLSILYLNDELLPLIPKFVGNISLNFTGDGLSSDFKQIISKSIELQTNGATASQAYACQVILSNLYRNFYRIKHDTGLPALGGFVNAWPPLYLYFGSSIDEVNSSMYNYDFYSRFMNFAVRELDFEITDGTVSLKFSNVLRTPSAYNNFKNTVKLPEFEDNEWFFQQNKTYHSILNVYWFRAMLDSRNFQVAVLNINEIRRAYDSLYMASGNKVIGVKCMFSVNSVIEGIMLSEPKVTKYYDFFRTINKKCIMFLEYMETIEDYTIKTRPDLSFKPCSANKTEFSDLPMKNIDPLQVSVELCRPELKKYLFINKTFGKELEDMRLYLERHKIPNNIRFVKSFFQTILRKQDSTSYFYCKTTSKNRTFNDLEGAQRLIFSNFSSNKVIDYGSKMLVGRFKPKFNEIADTIKELVMGSYIYNIYRSVKFSDISELPIKINNEVYMLRNFENALDKNIGTTSCIGFINLINNDEHKININSFSNWCFFKKRQGRVGDDWVGKGKVELKVDDVLLELDLKNTQITGGRTKLFKEMHFSNESSFYLKKLISDLKLNFYNLITPIPGKLYLGYDSSGYLGLHNHLDAKVGIEIEVENTPWDLSTNMDNCIHNFYKGNHYVNISSINYRLHTLDEIIYRENKKSMFELIDWENMSDYNRNLFISSFFSGEYGDLNNLHYVKSDLINNFLQTDIYKLFYNKSIKGNLSIKEEIWSDIVNSITYSEDIFPTLYENLNLAFLESILPREKLDNIALYEYYDKDPEVYLNFNNKFSSIENEVEKKEFFVKHIMDIKDIHGITLLPEIGDEKEFLKFDIKNKIEPYYIKNAVNILCDAIYSGYLSLSEQKKSSFFNNYRINIRSQHTIQELFYMDFVEKEDNNYLNCRSAEILTKNTILIHDLVDEIFSNKSSFSEYSRAFRKTQLKQIPRHPKYLENHQILIANLINFLIVKNTFRDLNDVPSHITRIINLKNEHPFTELSNNQLQTMPIGLSLYYNYKSDFEEINYMNFISENLDIFKTSKENFKEQRNTFREIIDDELELDSLELRKNKRLCIATTVQKISGLLDEEMNDSDLISPVFVPTHNLKEYRYKNRVFFVSTNINHESLKPVNAFKYLAFAYNKYIGFYNQDIKINLNFLVEKEESYLRITEPEVNTEYTIKKIVDITNPESYTEENLKLLFDEMEIEDSELYEKCLTIFNSNKYPSVKYRLTKKTINDQLINKLDMNKELEELIKSTFKKEDIDINIRKEQSIKQINKQSNELIINLTNYKKEFKQLIELTKGMCGDVIIEKLKLSSGMKRNLVQSLKLLLQQLKIRKMKNECALCRVLINLVSSAKEGIMNDKSHEFDEMIREYISDMTDRTIDDDSIDEIDEPVYSTERWQMQVR